jgi:hypothetical protein
MSTVLTKTELRASNDGSSVEIRAFDVTHENANWGGVLTFEHRMHWKEAYVLGKAIVDASCRAARRGRTLEVNET